MKKTIKKSAGRILAGITSRTLMSIAAGLLVLSYLSVFINPAKAWFMTVFGLLFIPLAILNLMLLVWALKRRSRTFLIPLLSLLPTVFFFGKYFQFSSSANEDDADIKIVSYTVGRFRAAAEIDDTAACMDSIASFLKRSDADVICLQEFHIKDVSGLKSYLSKKFRGYNSEYYMNISNSGASGNVTLSRFPVRGKGKIVFEKSANMALYTDIAVKGETLRIYNCHLESYSISLPRIVKSFRNKDREFFRKTEEKVRRSIARRPRQVDMVLENIAASPLPALVCGDFNDNPMSYTYYRISKGRSDSFVEAGRGFGATYSFLWPMLRIDYIIFPDTFSAVSHITEKVKYSDHFPVIAGLSLGK